MSKIKSFLGRYAQKACRCTECGRVELYDIRKRAVCRFCGCKDVRPTNRP